jgi:hypothetical protein
MKAWIFAFIFCCSTVQAQLFKDHADCMRNSKLSSDECKRVLDFPELPKPEEDLKGNMNSRWAAPLTSAPIWADFNECMSRSKLSSSQCAALYNKPAASATAPVVLKPAFQSFKECMERSKLVVQSVELTKTRLSVYPFNR